MAVYWVSFRIHQDSGYQDTYDELMETFEAAFDTSTWWAETTSFIIAESSASIEQIAKTVKATIRTDRDLCVIGMPEFKSGRVIGKCDDQDIFKLLPFMKKV